MFSGLRRIFLSKKYVLLYFDRFDFFVLEFFSQAPAIVEVTVTVKLLVVYITCYI